jgi:regulator of sigma E protease
VISVIGFLIMLAPLVVVHELGHFLFAKLFNVKAEAFSIGFGPKLWAKQIGETEWKVSLIPLGGYVKLLGEDPEQPLSDADKKRALQNQAPYKRFFIFFGGPCFNFLWAIIVYMTIMVVGEPEVANVIGRVVSGSPAEKAGFLSNDVVLKVDGQPVKKFEEIAKVIDAKPNQSVAFEVERKDWKSDKITTVNLTATPTTQTGFSIYGEETHVGEIEGLLPIGLASVVGVSNLDSPAGKLLVRTGDEVTQVNGKAVSNFADLAFFYDTVAPEQTFTLQMKSKVANGELKSIEFKKPKNSAGLGPDFGLYSSELLIDKTMPKSPAAEAGLRTGDRLVSIDGSPIPHFFGLREAVQKAGETKGELTLAWEREGKMLSAIIKPTGTNSRDPLLKKTTQFTIGVIPIAQFAEPKMLISRVLNPFTLLYKGTERMLIFTYRNFVSIKKMFTGEVSTATLGGPILIGKIAGESLSRGLIAFLSTMAILSIGLGVLNILPVPVLDGGHILLLGLEVIRKKPLSMKSLELVQKVGLSVILLLMVVVFKNDIMRLPFFN